MARKKSNKPVDEQTLAAATTLAGTAPPETGTTDSGGAVQTKKSRSKLIVPAAPKLIVPSAPRIRVLDTHGPLPLEGDTHVMAMRQLERLISQVTINPPPGPGRDRTGPDKDRFRDKVRDKVKENLGDIIRNNPIFGDKGKIKIPVDGGKEPRWRPGRDGQGGGGRGRKGSKDKGDLVYVDMDMEDFLNILFDGVDLPFLRKTDQAQMLVRHIKIRGITPRGPRARIDWMASEMKRTARAIAVRLNEPERFAHLEEDEVPDQELVPFEPEDLCYRRAEERWDPDSKAVAFLILDRSGSMGGEPLAIAKFFFLLNILFLRYRYKDVRIVMIAHDGQAYEIQNEEDFYKIEVDGGTMFVPAYEMTWQIAEARFSPSSWNRYVFQATDGYMFDGNEEVTAWYRKFIKNKFEYAAYLEIDPWAGRGFGGSRSWAPGGQALLALEPSIRKRVGMARVSSIDEVLAAFKTVLNPDRQEA